MKGRMGLGGLGHFGHCKVSVGVLPLRKKKKEKKDKMMMKPKMRKGEGKRAWFGL